MHTQRQVQTLNITDEIDKNKGRKMANCENHVSLHFLLPQQFPREPFCRADTLQWKQERKKICFIKKTKWSNKLSKDVPEFHDFHLYIHGSCFLKAWVNEEELKRLGNRYCLPFAPWAQTKTHGVSTVAASASWCAAKECQKLQVPDIVPGDTEYRG